MKSTTLFRVWGVNKEGLSMGINSSISCQQAVSLMLWFLGRARRHFRADLGFRLWPQGVGLRAYVLQCG